MATVKIKGMSCQHCVASIMNALNTIPEIANVQVDLKKGEASFEGGVDVEAVKAKIQGIGFEVIDS